ncbi:hypothetical protein H4219_004023 [Mycoemilia scoparia]|uniref:HAM1-like N-terminal domain-containing protein n=1 Tax=Mycoemilia scoparia TaxID=417184 RepID=A0A9W7ZTH2_9FUNG|nr:hypothetical protein H4219_004023 [Mycoemilia scoparia]
MPVSQAEGVKPRAKPVEERLPRHYMSGTTRDMFEQLVVQGRVPIDYPKNYLSPRERALQRKLSMVKLIHNVKRGILPSTEEITSELNHIDFRGAGRNLQSEDLKQLLKDLESTSDSVVHVLEEKNEDNLMQDVLIDFGLIGKHELEAAGMINTRTSVDSTRSSMESSMSSSMGSKRMSTHEIRDNLMTMIQAVTGSKNFRNSMVDLGGWMGTVLSSLKAERAAVATEGEAAVDAALNRKTVREEMMPLIDSLRTVVLQIQRRPGVAHSIKSLFSTFSHWYAHAEENMTNSLGVADDPEVQNPPHDARESAIKLFTRFAGGKSAEPLADSMKALFDEHRRNVYIQEITHEWKKHLEWVLDLEPSEVASDEFADRTQPIILKTRELITPEEREAFENFRNESSAYLDAVQEDPTMAALSANISNLTSDLTMSKIKDRKERKRRLTEFRHDLVTNIPNLLRHIRYIPLPRIQSVSKDAEFALDNLVIDIEKFVPHRCAINSRTEVYPRATVIHDDNARHSRTGYHSDQFFDIEVHGILCDAKDVAFYFKNRKFIRMAEKGLVDIKVGGKGMDINFTLRRLHKGEKLNYRDLPMEDLPLDIDPNGPRTPAGRLLTGPSRSRSESKYRLHHEFEIVSTSSKIHNLKFHFHDTKRDHTNNILAPILGTTIRRRIAKQVAIQLKPILEQADGVFSRYGVPILKATGKGAVDALVEGDAMGASDTAKNAKAKGKSVAEQVSGDKAGDGQDAVSHAAEEVGDKARAGQNEISHAAEDATADMTDDESATEDATADVADDESVAASGFGDADE